MKYQALYRKYRPSNFNDIVGQNSIVQTLKNSIREKKITHAYLLCGPRGTGKTSVAKLIAKTVNCIDTKGGNPCEQCVICKQIANKGISDIIEIDAASNNGVDEIREIRSKVNLVPSECKYKVYIIDEVHMLSTGAFNALLKTLEEPPAHVIFILATTEVHKVPITIISRCQRYDFKKITNSEIEYKLKKIIKEENIKIDDEAIFEITRIADGALRDAEGILDKLIVYTNNNIKISDVYSVNGIISKKDILKLLNCLINNEREKVLNQIDKFNTDGKDLFRLIESIMTFLRDYIIYNNAPKYFEKDKQTADFFSKINLNINEESAYELIKLLNDTNNEMKISNNPKIILEISLLSYKNNNTNYLNPKKNIEMLPNKVEFSDKEINISTIKKIRINNTLATANKNVLKQLKHNWKNIGSHIVDVKHGLIAGLLIDFDVKVAGESNILITYKYASMVDRVNNNLFQIEKTLNEIFNKEYKVIATTEEEWNEIRKEYVKKQSQGEKYEIINEPLLNKINKNKKGDKTDNFLKMTVDLFGENIVEIK